MCMDLAISFKFERLWARAAGGAPLASAGGLVGCSCRRDSPIWGFLVLGGWPVSGLPLSVRHVAAGERTTRFPARPNASHGLPLVSSVTTLFEPFFGLIEPPTCGETRPAVRVDLRDLETVRAWPDPPPRAHGGRFGRSEGRADSATDKVPREATAVCGASAGLGPSSGDSSPSASEPVVHFFVSQDLEIAEDGWEMRLLRRQPLQFRVESMGPSFSAVNGS